MAMNKFMHPRNIYKNRPDFKQLALEFPEFKKYVTQDLKGRISIDFKNEDALRALSYTLLKKDFGLNVIIPPKKLIPTIPLRLNYLLWIEDLLSVIIDKEDTIKGLDIGTGASCIYPLLAAKKFGWSMIGTEIIEESYKCAMENITQNQLNEKITVLKMKDENCLLKEVLQNEENNFHFTMCNPPFFSFPKDLECKGRTVNRPTPKNAFCYDLDEVVTSGGELQFLYKMADESKEFSNKVKIFTTMIGHKCNTFPLKKKLKALNAVSLRESEFCQGNTTRWGLAWTFYNNIDLSKVPESTLSTWRKEKDKPVYEHKFKSEETLATINGKVLEIFKTLLFKFKEIARHKNEVAYNITALSNTWSNSRRKRRMLARQMVNNNEGTGSKEENDLKECQQLKQAKESNDEETSNNVINDDKGSDAINNKKRALSDDVNNECSIKKLKMDDESVQSTKKPYLQAIFYLKQEQEGFILKLSFVDSAESIGGKDMLHQVMQYFKNNLKL